MGGSGAAFWIALLAMLLGLAGTVLPALPGIGLVWLSALIYGIADRFTTLPPLAFAAITILAIIGVAADLLLTQAGSRVAGASGQAMVAAIVLGAVGFVLGIFVAGIGAVAGGIIGAVAGVVIVEYRRRGDLKQALKAGGGWLAGCLASRAMQFAIALVMVFIFVWQAGVRAGAM